VTLLAVVDRPDAWPSTLPGVTVVDARDYLGDAYADATDARVQNLCAADRYQGRAYYVSLLAEARGHAPEPDVRTIEAVASGRHELQAHDDERPWTIDAGADDRIDVLATFGRDPAQRNDAACERLYAALNAPLVRAAFVREHGAWRIERLQLLGACDLDAPSRDFALRAAASRVPGGRAASAARARPRIAMLRDPDAADRPSNVRAIERFHAIAGDLGVDLVELRCGDIERLPGFDALFIRDTTNVNHYTYRFARRAQSEGLVVIDDPESILRCSNKVYLWELLSRHRIPTPRTLIVHRGNADDVLRTLGVPCIVKQPDSAFSRGVSRIAGEDDLRRTLAAYFETSELVVAQEWLPTAFDWRVGVLDGWPLFVCKYLMAPGHWQVVKRERDKVLEGATIALPVSEAPAAVVRTAVQAANLIGDGLYGVDVKQVRDKPYVIEVNDNPNLDAGNEDAVLGDALYREVLGTFVRRIRERRGVEA
jgi:glutathione synthase/RimK-type ligase-like ATP-grasp enzyme